MLNKRGFRIILSLIIAILLWAYVVGSVDPSSKKQIRSIPITAIHTDVLAERGLAVSGMGAETLDIEVSGSRLDIGDLEASDITATVDMASATRGENELTVIVRVPSGVEVTERSLNKVVVTVDELIMKEVDVAIVYSGTFAEDQEGSTLNISTPVVTVSGAESIVGTVESVRGTIDASRLSNTATELTCQLIAVNKEGNQVEDVTLSQETVTVRSILSETKGVGVTVEIVDNSSDHMARNTEIPEVLYITGTADVIKNIDTIQANPVDITNIAEDSEIQLEFELPEGVTIAEKNESTALKLTVSPLESKTLVYRAQDIEIRGNKSKHNYELTEDLEVTVTVMDSAAVLDEVTKDSIKLYVDVSELGAEAEEIGLLSEYEGKFHSLDINPASVNITVTEIASNGSNGN